MKQDRFFIFSAPYPVIAGHLLEEFTNGKTYEMEYEKGGGGWLRYTYSDGGEKTYISNNALREFFILINQNLHG